MSVRSLGQWGIVVFACGLVLGTVCSASAEERPNVLWLTCEDISPLLGCYGDSQAVTPNLDRMAKEGVRYTRAFASASVCSPARSSLITGVYPTSLGTQHLRSRLPLPQSVGCFSAMLRRGGYFCTNNVKEDYQFATPPDTWDVSSGKAHWRSSKRDRPFFSVFNFTTTHQSQIRLSESAFAKRTERLTPEERHDPTTIRLPPYYPDTPIVRRDVARLYDLITAMDKQVGDKLAELAEDGLDDETIVFFYSDHGTGMPRHKRWPYDSGLHVPMIVRFPEKYQHLSPGKPGEVVDRLVSFVDFAPTVLSLVGLKIPESIEGRAFLGPQADEPREYVYAIRDRVDEVIEMRRAVRDARFLYVRNYLPHRPEMPRSWYSEQTPTRQELRRLHAAGKLKGTTGLLMQSTRPREELYDTATDPQCLRNLADCPHLSDELERLRAAHRAWVLRTFDTGFLPEADMYARSGRSTPYDMARDAKRYPLARILDTAELVGSDASDRDEMVRRLKDTDPAVRYWASVALTALGSEALPAADALRALLDDASPNVRLAAAEALGHAGLVDECLPVLVEGLRHENVWIRLHATDALHYLGEAARPAEQDVRKYLAKKQTQKAAGELYVRWGLSHVVDLMESVPVTNNQSM